MPFVFLFFVTFSLTVILTALLVRLLLPLLRRHHVGQRILEIGPAWHRSKEGTPTMGGIAFVIATALSLTVGGAILSETLPLLFWRPLLLTGLYAIANAAVGGVDDLTKFRKSQNEGLTPPQKLVLQIALAAAYIALLRLYGYIDTSLYIPYFNTIVELSYAYDLMAILLAVGFVNFVNLSDGIDGLASATSLVLAAFFAAAAAYLGESPSLLLAATMMGACLGFLFFNRHPAKLFMGDTGSLFLGAMAVGCGFLLGNPLLLFVVGGVFVLEGASVILQVAWFKVTGKRLFLMAPFHHHLEKRGLSENRIVLLFVLLGILAALLGIPGLGG